MGHSIRFSMEKVIISRGRGDVNVEWLLFWAQNGVSLSAVHLFFKCIYQFTCICLRCCVVYGKAAYMCWWWCILPMKCFIAPFPVFANLFRCLYCLVFICTLLSLDVHNFIVAFPLSPLFSSPPRLNLTVSSISLFSFIISLCVYIFTAIRFVFLLNWQSNSCHRNLFFPLSKLVNTKQIMASLRSNCSSSYQKYLRVLVRNVFKLFR